MKVFLSLAVISLSAVIALAAQESKFPDGPGKAILERACGSCHGADVVTKYHFATPQEYKDIVDSMIGTGAQVSPTELPVLVDYLYKNYGKKTEPGAADPGKAILEAACTTCHGLDGLANHKYADKGPYESLVDNMVAYGAAVTAAQKPALIDYMFKTYGKK
jgi:mono/diheme cytochrome c family protein